MCIRDSIIIIIIIIIGFPINCQLCCSASGRIFCPFFITTSLTFQPFFSYHNYIRSICWMYWFHFSGFLCNLSRLLLKQFIDSACPASLGRWFMTRYEKNCLRFRKPCPCLPGNQFKHFLIKKKYLFLVAT